MLLWLSLTQFTTCPLTLVSFFCSPLCTSLPSPLPLPSTPGVFQTPSSRHFANTRDGLARVDRCASPASALGTAARVIGKRFPDSNWPRCFFWSSWSLRPPSPSRHLVPLGRGVLLDHLALVYLDRLFLIRFPTRTHIPFPSTNANTSLHTNSTVTSRSSLIMRARTCTTITTLLHIVNSIVSSLSS
jgi:hypothetical protein